MEIKIKNKIKVGDQTEIIEEIHTCEVMEKGDYTYLVHHNSEKEKVVIKLNQDELVMTRFSNPKSIPPAPEKSETTLKLLIFYDLLGCFYYSRVFSKMQTLRLKILYNLLK